MAHLRPSLNLTNGRVQMPLRVPLTDLMVGNPNRTYITTDTASASGTLTVKNIAGFAVNQILMIGEPGNQGTEIIKTHASTPPSGSTITLASNTVLPHPASTPVYIVLYDQVEFSRATTLTGSKSVVQAATAILADQQYTEYNDITNSSGFYFVRYKETIGNTFSDYSDASPYAGYGILSARSIINASLEELGKEKNKNLSDVFFYTQIDNCQTEVLRELKRWTFMQKFDSIIGQGAQGSWKFVVPTDLDEQNSNQSVYNLRFGRETQLTWVDKEKFNEFMVGTGYTTLASTLNVGDSTMTLTNSHDFDSTGTVTIGAYTYTYTANNTTTGVLTLSVVVPTGANQVAGADVFFSPESGLPRYWTTYGGYIYTWPLVASTYAGRNWYMDYYTAQTRVTDDNSTLIVPDAMLVTDYLCWKALKKLNSGEETPASQAYQASFLARKDKLKRKEVLNRTFKFKPRYNNFSIAMEFDSNDPRQIRDAGFPGT